MGIGQAGEVPVGESVVQVAEIGSARLARDARGGPGLVGEQVEVIEAPPPRLEQQAVHRAHPPLVGAATRGPDREDEGQAGPGAPCLAEVDAPLVQPPCLEREGGVADHQHRVVREAAQSIEVARLGPDGGEARLDLPQVTTEQLEQQDRRAGRRGP
ncbi:MAG: hypothetical protein MUC69_09275, partial [Gemmatimonadales bacterium]|nr:hypothetical protein [Gemmatimonadales bacterium]